MDHCGFSLVEGHWLVVISNMKRIEMLLIFAMMMTGCGKESQNDDAYQEGETPEEMVTFEKDIENTKTAVRQTKDGGYIVAGGQGGQAWLKKLDRYGDEEWQNTYTLGDFGYTRSVVQTSDGGYLYSSYEGIVKADSNGIEEWKNKSKTVGAYPYYEDAIEHSSGNIYAVGGPSGGQGHFVKFSSTGEVLKRKFYGSKCEDDIFRSITESQDGMLVVAGEKAHGNQSFDCAFNFMYYKDFWILKLKKNGGVIWEKAYGGPYMEKADDIVALDDGGYALVGDKCDHGYDIGTCGSKAKVLYMRLNGDGDLVEEQSWSGLNFQERIPWFSITTTAFGGIAWTAEHKRKGTWVHKWGPNEETVSIFPDGYGGFDINRTTDDGFIIGTWGGIVIKTDSEFVYDLEVDE